MPRLFHDLKLALRGLAKSPGFALAAILTLGLGIGAATAIFSVVDAVLLSPLPYADAGRLETLWNSYSADGLGHAAISPIEVAELGERLRSFSSLAAFTNRGVAFSAGEEPEQLQAFVVSPSLFRVLGLEPALGRDFRPEEGREGDDRVALLSDALWRRAFAADPAILGETIRLDGTPYTVAGVMPRGIRFPDAPGFLFSQQADLWLPRAWETVTDRSRGDQFLRLVGRLAPGATPEGAQRELDALGSEWRRLYPRNYPAESGWHPLAVPLPELVQGDVRPALLLLAGAVGLVLLIACANVANLLLVRASARARELAVRTALGAGRGRLMAHLLAESLLLALAGGAVGVILATWGVDLLTGLGPADVPRLGEAAIDLRVLAFALAASLASALLAGLAPALRLSRPDLAAALGERAGAGAGPAKSRLRAVLVALEAALAVVVLAGAGLLARSFSLLQGVDLGFTTGGVLTCQVTLPRTRYPDRPARAAFFAALLDRFAALPGVEAAGGADPLPLSGDAWGASFEVEGQPVPPGAAPPHAELASVAPGYFRSLAIPLLAGRPFGREDTPTSPQVAIVDETLAHRTWPGEDPIGKHLDVGGPAGELATVVGVVGHVRSEAPWQPGEAQIYLPYTQNLGSSLYLTLKTAGDPLALAAAVRAATAELDRDQPVARVTTLDSLLARTLARRRFDLLLLSLFAGFALLLAAVGLYAVTSAAAALRRHEIGVRMALGARPRAVVALVLAQGLAPTLAGLAAGSLAALAASRLLAGLLYGVAPTDPFTFLAAAALLGLVALAACALPAWRAARLDPLAALRRD